MTREELGTAAEHLRTATEAADGDAAERLSDIAEKLDSMATVDRGPDHGSLARIQNALTELSDDVPDAAVDAIADAKDAVSEYRSTVEGV